MTNRWLPFTRRLGPVLVVMAAAIGGCSKDFFVLDSTESGGAGPRTDHSDAGSTASPGTGGGGDGGAIKCDSSKMAGPPVRVEPPNVGEQRAPALVLSKDDGSEVSVVFQHFPELDLYTTEIAYVRFEPWGAWPSGTVGPSLSAATTFGSFAVSQAPGHTFNTLWTDSSQTAWLRTRPPTPSDSEPLLVRKPASHAAFVATQGGRHLLGHGEGGMSRATVAQSSAGGATLGATFGLGCAEGSDHLPAAAVPSGAGWLVAFATGEFSTTGCPDPGPPGWPVAIQVTHLLDGGTSVDGARLVQGPVSQILMAPRSDDGAWLVWQRVVNTFAPIEAVRLDAAGKVVLGPVEIVPSSQKPLGFGVSRMGDDLVVAYRGTETPEGIRVLRVRGDGVAAPLGSVDASTGTEPPSVVVSPAGDKVLVAFETQSEVGVVRFDCTSAQ